MDHFEHLFKARCYINNLVICHYISHFSTRWCILKCNIIHDLRRPIGYIVLREIGQCWKRLALIIAMNWAIVNS